MGVNKLSGVDLAAYDLADKNTTGLGYVNNMKYAIRAIREITSDGAMILEDKKATASLKKAREIEEEFKSRYSSCRVEVLNSKGQVV